MKNYRQAARALALLTQLGISMLTPILLCIVAGNWIDQKTGWSMTVFLMLLGMAAGARNCWILVQKAAEMKKGTEKSGGKKSEKNESDAC